MKSISVVIATYNRKDSLLETLHALENQTLSFTDFDVIVINDGSSDETETALMDFKRATFMDFKYLRQSNKGPIAARNLGIYRAQSSIVAFTDDDCVPATDWLEQIKLNFLEKPIIGLHGSTITKKSEITPLTHQVDNENRTNSMSTCNAAYDRLILLELEGFDEKLPFHRNKGVDLAWRVQKKGTIGFCKEMIVHHPPRKDRF